LVLHRCAAERVIHEMLCCADHTVEIHEAQQENVAEGDRNRSKSTALTTDNCGVLNSVGSQVT
jgi:hypothetical protein